jgi:hypothetical protein
MIAGNTGVREMREGTHGSLGRDHPLCVVSAAGAEVPPRWAGSWADSLHIWVADYHHESCTLPGVIACGTEDGGATWHPIIRHTDSPYGVVQMLRTSPNAGLLALLDTPRPQNWQYFWTIDAGRHWIRTSLFGDHGFLELLGHGHHVYWRSDHWKVLNTIAEWPPRARPGCPGGWTYDLGNPDAPPTEWGAFCLQPPSRESLRRVVAKRYSRPRLMAGATVPHGAVFVLVPVRRRRPAVLWIQSGRQRELRLPEGKVPRGTRKLDIFDMYAAEWPYAAVNAVAWGPPRNGRPYLLGCVLWETRDSGRTWRSRHISVRDGWDTTRICNF